MTLSEIQEQVMFQTNNDADDLGDYTPHIDDYINEGYDRIVIIWDNKHVPCTDYPRLENDSDTPILPEWIHRYIADWATWLIYRNGNPQKQQRGMQFKYHFEQLLSKLASAGGKNGLDENGNPIKYDKFRNIPR
jgi:hypothetical protein